MPKTVKEKIIRVLLDNGSITRSALERMFDGSAREKAKEEISNMLSQGAIIQTGLGKRGMPFILHRSPIWPYHEKCFMCGQRLPLESVLSPEDTIQIKSKVKIEE